MGAPEATAQADAVTCRAAGDTVVLHDLTSEELAGRAKEGCPASFTELVHRHAPRLQAFLHRRTGDRQEAEDLVQDTLLKAYQNLDRYRPSWRFSTWLFTIATRLAISRHRRKQPTCPVPDLRVPAPDEVLDMREQRESLWALAAELPGGQYQALWLRYGEDMSVREMARALGKSQIGVKVMLYRARTHLAKRLEEFGPRF